MPKTAAALALALVASSVRAQPPGKATPPPSPGVPSPAPSGPVPATAGPARAVGTRTEPPPAKVAVPRGAVLEEVSGVVREVDRKAHKLTVEAVSGPVTLSLDRNTMVYTAGGLGTVLDLAPGQQIRAGRNVDFLAYWVQLRVPARPEPSPAPGRAPAPTGGGAVPAGDSGGGTPPAPPTAVPGSAPSPSPPAPPR